ncbi:MAG TPA: protein-L-isoaspartate O-methyltransferase [Steroidobacteraceae bacterium]|jgi:protein-L-isoaspartate(D-aspartate) O-methyltransferase|nr:protein-L-isoaspartate O-methyltransferase [Steroidobacteraceae bacterium]
MQTDFAREQMIEQQLRTWEVFDQRALDAVRTVPREQFVPPAWRGLAFADCDIALAHGKRMLRPMLIGRILQELALVGGEEIVEIGTGSGFLSACMAQLGGRVRSLELHPDIAESARANLRAAAPTLPVEITVADGMQFSEVACCDVLVLTASLPIYQDRFERALKVGGRLFVVAGAAVPQEALIVRRVAQNEWIRESLFETALEPMEHAPRPEAFGF